MTAANISRAMATGMQIFNASEFSMIAPSMASVRKYIAGAVRMNTTKIAGPLTFQEYQICIVLVACIL